MYVYVLQSKLDNKLYIGCTKDLKDRVHRHNKGYVRSTKARRPLKLIYFEEHIDKYAAFKQEAFYKTATGKRKLLKKLMVPSSSG